MKIKWKLFIYLLSFCALLLLLLWFFQIVLLDSIYERIKVSEIEKAMNNIVAYIEKDEINEIVESLNQNKSIDVEILINNESFLVSDKDRDDKSRLTQNEKSRLYNEAKESGSNEFIEKPHYASWTNRDNDNEMDVIRESLEPQPPPTPATPTAATNTRNQDNFGQKRFMQQITYCKILDGELGDEIIIFLTSMISPVDSTVDTLRVEFFFIAGFMVLFSIVMAVIISRKIAKPLVSINTSAKSLAEGKYDITFQASGYREISELSNTLNVAAEELSTVENLQRELIANVSHDLKTPLTLIAGYAEVMRDLPDENTPENAQIIVDEATRLTTLVCDLLDLSKNQSGVFVPQPEEYNLTQSIRDTVKRIAEMTKQNGYKIIFNSKQDVFVYADEAQISQVIYNLMINAINFTGEDKTIVVKQIIEKKQVCIQVIDSGRGIREKELSYVWNRYYRTDNNHQRVTYGSGIGLSIVKSIIDLHDGQYGVTSTYGKGSTFWVSIPYIRNHDIDS